VRARVFGVLEGLAVAAAGLGSAFGGLLTESVGIRGAFLLAAAVTVVCALLASRLACCGEPEPAGRVQPGLAGAES
jgi:MFS family permease